jgi:hypothetical protein
LAHRLNSSGSSHMPELRRHDRKRDVVVFGILESLIATFGVAIGHTIYEWSRGSEAKQLTDMLKRDHPSARMLLTQPDALAALWHYAGTGEFNAARMLAAVQQVENDAERAAAMVEAIEKSQWRTKKNEAHTHFEVLKAVFEIRCELTEATASILARLESFHTTPPSLHAPCHLPRMPRTFTNRVVERDKTTATLTSPPSAGAASAVVIALFGEPGVGKSMLALRVAHDFASKYPNGQLYANLRAPDGTAIPPGDAAAALLRQLSTADSAIPDDARERASMLRASATGRRLLLLLDNVVDHPVIPELIPANASCAFLVTSHEPIAGLDADLELEIVGFTEDDALALLDLVAQEGRVASNRETALELIELCRRIPLRIRAVGDWLRLSPGSTVADAVQRLRGSGYDRCAQDVFGLPYALLPAPAAALFRALGVMRSGVVSLEATAALSGRGLSETAALLRQIRRAGLIDLSDDGAELHELTHSFARNELQRRPEERSIAFARLSSWLLAGATAAAAQLEDRGRDD